MIRDMLERERGRKHISWYYTFNLYFNLIWKENTKMLTVVNHFLLEAHTFSYDDFQIVLKENKKSKFHCKE